VVRDFLIVTINSDITSLRLICLGTASIRNVFVSKTQLRFAPASCTCSGLAVISTVCNQQAFLYHVRPVILLIHSARPGLATISSICSHQASHCAVCPDHPVIHSYVQALQQSAVYVAIRPRTVLYVQITH
jgi:hypothetical protein